MITKLSAEAAGKEKENVIKDKFDHCIIIKRKRERNKQKLVAAQTKQSIVKTIHELLAKAKSNESGMNLGK